MGADYKREREREIWNGGEKEDEGRRMEGKQVGGVEQENGIAVAEGEEQCKEITSSDPLALLHRQETAL